MSPRGRNTFTESRAWAVLGLAPAAATFLALALAPRAAAQWCESARLVHEAVGTEGAFGLAVDLSDDGFVGVVSAPGANFAGTWSGAVWVVEPVEGVWTATALLMPEAVGDFSVWGWGIAISGDGYTVAVGGPAYSDGVTPVLAVYDRHADGSWTGTMLDVPREVGAFEGFGRNLSLSFDGDTLVVGADDYDDEDFVQTGGVWVHERDTGWVGQRLWTREPTEQLGEALAISSDGSIIAVADNRNSLACYHCGAVFVFERDGTSWQQVDVLTVLPGQQHWLSFAYAVALSDTGETIVVGEPDNEYGLVHVFRRERGKMRAWLHDATIEACHLENSIRLGIAVGVTADGNRIFAGTSPADAPSIPAVHVFDCDEVGLWHERPRIIGATTSLYPEFGFSLGLSADGDRALIGAYREVTDGVMNGAAYVYELSGALDCGGNGRCDWAEIARGELPDADENGVPDDCDADCDGSGVSDVLEIAAGLADDCNTNGRPDSCDLTDPATADCTGNGIPDACDARLIELESLSGAFHEIAIGEGKVVFAESGGVGAAWVVDLDDPLLVPIPLPSPNPMPYDSFGISLAIGGEYIFVGASGPSASLGAVHVFASVGDGGWVHEDTITSDDVDHLGMSLATDGDVVVVGGIDAVRVFERREGGWDGSALEIEDVDVTGTSFGNSLALRGDLLAVGAVGDDELAQGAGAVWIFKRDGSRGTWENPTKVLAWDGAAFDRFGLAVAISEEWLLIGAFGVSTPVQSAGAAYLYRAEGNAWVPEQKIQVTDPMPADQFGVSVALSGSLALVGTMPDVDRGALVVRHDGTEWYQQGWLTAPHVQPYGPFGSALALDGATAAVAGLTTGPCDYSELGGPMICDLRFADCDGDRTCDSLQIATGAAVDRDGNGIPDTCDAECGADLDQDGVVQFGDLTALLLAWGRCAANGTGDIDGDGLVGFADLLELIVAWGPCGA